MINSIFKIKENKSYWTKTIALHHDDNDDGVDDDNDDSNDIKLVGKSGTTRLTTQCHIPEEMVFSHTDVRTPIYPPQVFGTAAPKNVGTEVRISETQDNSFL